MSREPIVKRAFVMAAVGLAVALLGRFGVVVPPVVANNLIEVGAVVAPLAFAWWVRRHTTATKDPRANDGTPLVPAYTPSEQGEHSPAKGEAATPEA